MNDIQRIFEKHEFDPETQELFSLNFAIRHMDALPRTGIVEDVVEAHETALRHDPYMERALGHLAISAEYYGTLTNDSAGWFKGMLQDFNWVFHAVRHTKKSP